MALNFRKVRIGFMNLILDFLEGQDKAVKMSKDIIAAMKKDMGLDVIEFDEPVGTREQAAAAWKKFNAADVDAIILFSGTFNTGELAAEIVRNTRCPLATWGIGELNLGSKNFSGSVVGVMPVGSICKAFGRKFSMIYGTIDDPTVRRQLDVFVRAVRAIAFLREAAIGVIGMRPDGFQIAGFDELGIKQLFGTEIKKVSLYGLAKLVNAVSDKEIDADMEVQKKIFDIPKDGEKGARGLSQVYLALQKVIKEKNLQAFAPECWPEFRDEDMRPFCPANGRLSAEGVMASCECDVDGALTMMMLHAILEGTPWFADLVDVRAEHDALLFWHCGNASHTLGSKKPKIEKVFGGPSQIHSLKSGAVTVCRMHSTHGKFMIHAGIGQAIEKEPVLKGSNMLIRMKGGNMEFVKSLLANGIPHHNALIYGDCLEEIREYAMLMDIPLVIKD